MLHLNVRPQNGETEKKKKHHPMGRRGHGEKEDMRKRNTTLPVFRPIYAHIDSEKYEPGSSGRL